MIKVLKVNNSDESLSVSRQGSDSRGKSKFRDFDKSMLKCFTYLKIDSFKKDCPNRVGKDDYVHSAVDSYANEYGYKSFVVLVMSSSKFEMS